MPVGGPGVAKHGATPEPLTTLAPRVNVPVTPGEIWTSQTARDQRWEFPLSALGSNSSCGSSDSQSSFHLEVMADLASGDSTNPRANSGDF